MMPTAAECQAFFDELSSRGIQAMSRRAEDIKLKWPAREDRMAYYEWSSQTAEKQTAEANIPISRKDLQSLLHNINYNYPLDRGRLVDAIDRAVVPWLPVGCDKNGEIYRIVPAAYGLRADQENPKTHLEVLSNNVLGVNTNLPALYSSSKSKSRLSEGSPSSKESDFPERSTKSNDTDDPDIGGFVFHQIGVIERWGDEPENLTSYDDAAKGPWMPTGFFAVVRFGRSGYGNGIYIIQDFYPRDVNGKRETRIRGDHWGYLAGPDATARFSMVKIANTITELKFGRVLNFEEFHKDPVELVRAVKIAGDKVSRVIVTNL